MAPVTNTRYDNDDEDDDFDNDVANWVLEAGGTLLPLEFPQAAAHQGHCPGGQTRSAAISIVW